MKPRYTCWGCLRPHNALRLCDRCQDLHAVHRAVRGEERRAYETGLRHAEVEDGILTIDIDLSEWVVAVRA